MDGNQENFEFVDPETGEVFPMNAASLVSNVRDVILSRIKLAMTIEVWNKLSQADQQDHITASQELGRELVGSIVMRVAEKGLTCAHVEINKFAVDVDKSEVTITSKGFASDEMLTDLAHSKGKTAKITVVDAEQFNLKSTMVKPDEDQPSLLPDDDDVPIQLDDSDGLHGDDNQPEPANENHLAGYNARMNGAHSNDSPFEDMESPERNDWYLGWKEADERDDAPEVKAQDDAPAEPTPDTDGGAGDGEATDQTHFDQGLKAAINGSGTDDNPFDGGTDEYLEWDKGLIKGLKEVAGLRQSGYAARGDGMAPTRCTWKKGTPEHGFWMQGYEQAKADEAD